MKRTIDYYLLEWKHRPHRKPLILRGARQVGKTHAVRVLGKTFTNFIEINLESNQAARTILEKDLDLDRIVLQLSELLQKRLKPGSTLLFFDEIQQVPQAIIALRYFYEQMPDLHVIAAGSLLEFALSQVGIPVGRVTTLYMYPVSFMEFLVALGHAEWAQAILTHTPHNGISIPLHEKLLSLVGVYLAIGGMPEAVNEWIKTKTSRTVKIIHADLLYAYQQDFGKYAKKYQMKYLNLLFLKAIDQLSNKFMFSRVGEYQKRELAPCLELLERAGLFNKVTKSAAQGIPIGAQADLDDFKIIFLDVGLAQAVLKLDITLWFLEPLETFINKGELVEAFVGQELLAYSDAISKEELFYWHRDVRGSSAEVDYLVQLQDSVLPIEVKAGGSKRIKSMQIFLESHTQSRYGIRFWAGTYAVDPAIYSYPLYAVVKPLSDAHEIVRKALEHLIAS
ncbi:MAG: AAA family ATPase [Candidatus Dependentiae bacterium]|nr:AAA family ATPase [Candidatus Dependentiae bacterium]